MNIPQPKQERRKPDRECPVEQESEMLRRCVFSAVECVFLPEVLGFIALK
ncbi:MAG: hypothetical protein ACI4WS_01170 [Oscillospiraceae bacterium]